MSGQSIASEILAAMAEVATEVGDGEFVITLTRPATVANPWDAAGADTTFQLSGFVQDYPRSQIDGTLIRQEDRKVFIAAENGTKPLVSDRLTISGVSYAVVSVREIAPAGVPLYYEAQARA